MMLWRQPKRTAHPLQWVFISSNYALSHSCSARLIFFFFLSPSHPPHKLLEIQRAIARSFQSFQTFPTRLSTGRSLPSSSSRAHRSSADTESSKQYRTSICPARVLFLASQPVASWRHVNTPHMRKLKTSCHRNQLDKPLSHHGSSRVSVQLSRQPGCLRASDGV